MDLHGQIMNIMGDANKGGTDDPRIAYLIGHRDARHAAAELANEHVSIAEELRQEVERCFDIAQKLDAMNSKLLGAFRGTPSERILRQINAIAETI